MAGLPVDHGWAWVVLFGSFINLFLVMGTIRILGMVFVEVVEYYQSNSTIGSLIFSMMMAARCATVPTYPLLVRYFTIRMVVAASGVLLSLAFLSFSFSPNIYVFATCFGVMSGIGGMLVHLGTLGILGHYFKKKISFATAVVSMGSSLGSLVMPQYIAYLSSEYGLSGATIVAGGTLLHIVAAATLLRPPSFYAKSPVSLNGHAQESNFEMEVTKDPREREPLKPTGCKITETPAQTSPRVDIGETDLFKMEQFSNTEDIANSTSPHHEHEGVNNIPNKSDDVHRKTPGSMVSKMNQALKTDRFTGPGSMRATSSILCFSVAFRLIAVGRLLSVLAFYTLLFFIPPYMKSIGFNSSQVALLMTINGAVDTGARFCHGWIVTHSSIKSSLYCGICTLIGSIGIYVSVIKPSFLLTMTVVPTVFAFYGAINSIGLAVVMECVGPKLYPSSVIFTEMPSTALMIFMPLAYGLMVDLWDSYTIPMCITASCGIVGGMLTASVASTEEPVIRL